MTNDQDTMLGLVGEFHQAFEINEPDHPCLPGMSGMAAFSLRRAAEHIRAASQFLHTACKGCDGAPPLMRGHLMAEELAEVLDAMADGNLVQVLHELVDCEVVHKGSVRALGLAMSYPDAQLAVHNANMSKLGEDGRPIKNAAGRIMKGPHFVKADLTDLIEPAYRQVKENT